ncbi:MAG: IS4 family transposase [Deltaproteobacteria bacterium]|nr:IS4 family transposase [Deltaproteobacteria bacterium]MBT7713445.1 IS4 family transposase [Deltaproteobacteria bacterium]
MNPGKSVFSQIVDLYPKYHFDKLVQKYKGDFNIRHFKTWDQFLCMTFAQLTYRSSLRDIEACLLAQPQKLYHMGINGKPSRNNIARANQKRDWRIYYDFAQVLIERARGLYQHEDPISEELDSTVYALDATTIDLCLSMFPWATFRKTKGAIKMHTLLDLKGSIPSFIEITEGSVHEVRILDNIPLEPGSFYLMDRGYLDFKRLYNIHKGFCYFVIRAKKNLKFRRQYSNPIDPMTKIRADQICILEGFYAKQNYPEKLRRIKIYDADTESYLTFLTNKVRLCECSEPQSEPFVGQARPA